MSPRSRKISGKTLWDAKERRTEEYLKELRETETSNSEEARRALWEAYHKAKHLPSGIGENGYPVRDSEPMPGAVPQEVFGRQADAKNAGGDGETPRADGEPPACLVDKVVSPVQDPGPRASCLKPEGVEPRRWKDLSPAEKEELKDWGEFLQDLMPHPKYQSDTS